MVLHACIQTHHIAFLVGEVGLPSLEFSLAQQLVKLTALWANLSIDRAIKSAVCMNMYGW